MLRLMIIAAILGLTLAACSGADGESAGIPVQDADLVAAGDVLYQANCAECHGSDLRGTDKGPSDLSIVNVPGHHGDQAFVLETQRIEGFEPYPP